MQRNKGFLFRPSFVNFALFIKHTKTKEQYNYI